MSIKVPIQYETDGAQLDRDMSSDVTKAGGDAGKRGGKAFGTSFKSSAKGLLAAAGLLAGVDTAVDQLKQAIGGASDLVESSTKITAVFGEADVAVQKFASGGAKALGQTKQEALDAAATFGTFGKAAGLSGNDLAKFSTGLTGLSTDFASFFNASPETAVEAIGAALRGESEPIRQFGILLDDATLKAEALSLGLLKPVKSAAAIQTASVKATEAQKNYNDAIAKNGKGSLEALKAEAALGTAKERLIKATEGTIGPLTQQQKVLAAQSSIFKQSKDAQGDFARTSDGLANQSRILRAQLIDVRSELGAKLLPTVLDVVGGVSNLVTEFQNGEGTGGDIRDTLEEVGSALGDVADFGKDVLGLFNALPGPVKKTAVELGIAYLALRQIRAGMALVGGTGSAQLVGGLANAETRLTTTATAANRLGAGAKQAAGAGGLLLLATASQQTSKEMGALQGAVGGAAAGFAVGGPWGAGIGAIAGGLLGVFTSGKQAAKGISAADQASQNAIAGLDSLDTQLSVVTASYTKAARAAVSQSIVSQPAVVAAYKDLGLNISTVTDALLGNAKAQKEVDAAISAANTPVQIAAATNAAYGRTVDTLSPKEIAHAKAATTLADALGKITKKTKEERTEAVLTSLANTKLGESLKNIPDDTVLQIHLEGDKQARQDIKNLIRDGQVVNREQVRLLLKTAGLPAAEKDIDRIVRQAKEAAREYLLQFRAQYNPAQGQKNDPRRRARGGPVDAGVPYVVGDAGREIFVPDRPGRIEPNVPTTSSVSGGGSLTIIQNDYGPRSARAKVNEIVWAVKYGTRARGQEMVGA